VQKQLREQMVKLAHGLKVVGLMNAQFAIQNDQIYVLEVNPRASRTVPFLAKATGIPLADIAARCMAGVSLKKQGVVEKTKPDYFAVKKAVFPFAKFPGVDPILGPEMRSTGEVMGVSASLGQAFLKSELSSKRSLPTEGTVFVSVRDADKSRVIPLVKKLIDMGYQVVATSGTAKVLHAAGLAAKVVNKVEQGRPHIVDSIRNNEINLVINTTEGEQAIADSYLIRRSALEREICYTTTLSGAHAMCLALETQHLRGVVSLQNLYDR